MTPPKDIHSTILTAAAREILRPMGLLQKGRSRTWMDDRQWWVGVVEFQPSSWSRGTYLNVGCHWLWHGGSGLGFYEGGRVKGCSDFENVSQFEPVARSYAQVAAERVIAQRRQFTDVAALSNYHDRTRSIDLWKQFDAAIASALCGRHVQAVRWFDAVVAQEGTFDWIIAARDDAAGLRKLAADTTAFREIMTDRIARARVALKLPTLASIDFGDAR